MTHHSTPAVELRVYLAGNVRKGDTETRPASSFWSATDIAALRASAERALCVLDPSELEVNGSPSEIVVGCDLHHVETADVLLADCRGQRGIGVGAEMMFAKSNGVPIVALCPPASFYRRPRVEYADGVVVRDWIHPFLDALADTVVDDIPAAARTLDALPSAPGGRTVTSWLDAFRRRQNTSPASPGG